MFNFHVANVMYMHLTGEQMRHFSTKLLKAIFVAQDSMTRRSRRIYLSNPTYLVTSRYGLSFAG